MVPDNPCESYAMLVRESMQFDIPTPSRRIEIIRELPQPAVFNAVHIITGIRRCGKTFYLFQKIHDLLQNGVSRNDIFYFNFADDRLQPMQDTVLNDIVTEYWRQYPDSRDHGCYLFLDEVQECANWQGFCQRIAEHEAVTLVITGSSSKLSSEEIATNFRGRSHPHAMAPLSFREFCDFRGIETPTAGSTLADAVFSPREVTRFEAAYNDYLTIGGFPAVQRMVEADRIETLQGYVRDVVARDVAERLGRENITLATQIALFCCAIRPASCLPMVLWKRCERSAGKSIGIRRIRYSSCSSRHFWCISLRSIPPCSSRVVLRCRKCMPSIRVWFTRCHAPTSKILENDWKLRFSANCRDELPVGVRKQSLRTLCRRPNRRKLTFLSAMLLLRNRMGLFKCVPIWEMRKPGREKSALCKRLCNVPTLIPA